MINLSGKERRFIQVQLEAFRKDFQDRTLAELAKQSKRFTNPVEISSFLTELDELGEKLRRSSNSRHVEAFAPNASVPYADDIAPIIKAVISATRRSLAAQLEIEKNPFIHAGIRESIGGNLAEFDSLLRTEWFQNAQPRRVPQLSDYLTIECREELFANRYTIKPRSYDNKFGILMSSSLFIHDFRYYRARCEMRNAPLTVAYMDIDDFKSFNTRHGNSQVDRYLLPRLMRAIEDHLFFRGHAYQYGGDEYVAILPNASGADARRLISALQAKLATLEYEEVVGKPTLSIGFCVVDSECHLTELEIEEKACAAKDFAKQQGKNCVSTYEGRNFEQSTLMLSNGE